MTGSTTSPQLVPGLKGAWVSLLPRPCACPGVFSELGSLCKRLGMAGKVGGGGLCGQLRKEVRGGASQEGQVREKGWGAFQQGQR